MKEKTFKIILLAKYDLSANIACNELVPELLKRGHSVRIFLGDMVRKAERENERARSVIQLERDSAVEAWKKIDEVPENLQFGEDFKLNGRYLTWNQMSAFYGLPPCEIFKSASDSQFLQKIRDLEPDILLNVRNNMIYKKPIIEIPKIGIFNTHLGPLPKYAGLYAAYRQMSRNETQVGCTLHVIDEGIDTGAIIDIAYHPVLPTKSVVWHQIQMYCNGGKMFVKFVDQLASGKSVEDCSRVRREDEPIEYFGQVSDEEFEEFEKSGKKVACKEEIVEELHKYVGFVN